MTTEIQDPVFTADSMFVDDSDFASLFSDEALSMGDEAAATHFSQKHAEKEAARAKGASSEDFEWGVDDDPFYKTNSLSDEEEDEVSEDDDDPLDETSDIRDGESDGDDDEIDVSSFFANLPEDAEIAPGYTKQALTDLIRSKDEFSQQAAYMEHQFTKFEQGNDYIKEILGQNLTETNKTLHAIRQAMEDPHTDTVRKGQLFNELKRYEAKQHQIESDWQRAEEARKVQERYADEQRVFQTDLAMKQKYGRQFNYQPLVEYAVSSGIDVDTLTKAFSPALVEVLIKASKFDGNEQSKNIKLRETVAKAARSTSVSNRKAEKTVNTSSKRKDQVLREASAGNSKAVDAMFAMLED